MTAINSRPHGPSCDLSRGLSHVLSPREQSHDRVTEHVTDHITDRVTEHVTDHVTLSPSLSCDRSRGLSHVLPWDVSNATCNVMSSGVPCRVAQY